MNESKRSPLGAALAVTAVVLGLTSYAFRFELAGSVKFWIAFGLGYAALGAWALAVLSRRRILSERLRPRVGDITTGVFVAALLLLGSWVGRSILSPPGTASYTWLLAVYLQIGDPDAIQKSIAYTAVLLAICVGEELVWRGMVLEDMSARFGARLGWIAAAGLYALAHVPTLFTLESPIAGLNPLLVLAAIACGIAWSFLTHLTGRLTPAIVSHAVFTYFTVTQFRAPMQ